MTTYSVPIIARLLNARWGLLQMPPMFYMTDEERAPDPLLNINRLEPGTGVILRHYNIKSRFELGLAVKNACREKGCVFIVAGDCSLAHKLNADGLHLPEHLLLSPSLKIRLWGTLPNKILTASAHSQKALMKCAALPIDAALLSPVFPTESHLNKKTLGISKFQRLARQTHVPIYALGGINNKNAIQLIKTSAIGIAGIGAVLQN